MLRILNRLDWMDPTPGSDKRHARDGECAICFGPLDDGDVPICASPTCIEQREKLAKIQRVIVESERRECLGCGGRIGGRDRRDGYCRRYNECISHVPASELHRSNRTESGQYVHCLECSGLNVLATSATPYCAEHKRCRYKRTVSYKKRGE